MILKYFKPFPPYQANKKKGVTTWILRRNILNCGKYHGIFTKNGAIMAALIRNGNRLLKKAAIL